MPGFYWAVLRLSNSRIDAHIGIAARDDKWLLCLIGKNLMNEIIDGSSQSSGIEGFGHLNPPRTIALQAMFGF